MKGIKSIVLLLGMLSLICSAQATCQIFDLNTGKAAFIDTIKNTKEPIIIGSFKLNPSLAPDENILAALMQRYQQHGQASIIVEKNITETEKHGNQKISASFAYEQFKKTGAHVLSLHQFSNVHLKMIASPEFAFIGTTNFDGEYIEFEGRDFIVKLEKHPVVDLFFNTMQRLINNENIDWQQFNYDVRAMKPDDIILSWGPYFHKKHILDMIDMARNTIDIYQQDMQDDEICNELRKSVERGVLVRVLMSEHPFSKKNPNKSLPNLQKITSAGVHVRLTGGPIKDKNPVHIHAKVMIVDNSLMYVGSANFYPDALNVEENHLNVGIITNQKSPIMNVNNFFNKDWQMHQPYELSHAVH